MNFTIYPNDGTSSRTITGETLEAAIEANFTHIVKLVGIGNAAGYQLDRVWIDYAPGILGGKGGGLLHILAHGSDSLVNYDPIADVPREKVIPIGGINPGDLPEPLVLFEYSPDLEPSKKDFDPFDDEFMYSADGSVLPQAAYGTALAIIDHVSRYHCAFTEDDVSCLAELKMDGARRLQPRRFIDYVLVVLAERRPKGTKEAARLLGRAHELIALLPEKLSSDAVMSELLYYYKTRHYFNVVGRITALEHHRKKAGKTQQQVADEVGITVRQLRNYENARNSTLGDAKYSVVVRIARAVNATPDKLVQGGVAVRVKA